MSIRTALIGTLVLLGAATTGLTGAVFVLGIADRLRHQEQERVNYDLRLVRSQYDQQARFIAGLIENAGKVLPLTEETDAKATLQTLRDDGKLTLLNVCDVDGGRLLETHPESSSSVPIADDPILRKALSGQPSWGTALLTGKRIEQEGGTALVESVLVQPVQPTEENGPAALFWWAACPLRGDDGRVDSVVYGGLALNNNFTLVDELRLLAFGEESYDEKPLGTVTIFQNGLRVATNVVGPDGKRAIGTTVSKQVQDQVLGRGKVWQDRAWVVDAWYLSAYEPIRDTDGQPIGMLYVGLLEAPFRVLARKWFTQLAALILITSLFAIGFTVYVIRRITAPLADLVDAAQQMTHGNHSKKLSSPKTYAEITQLRNVFTEMRAAIAQRDQHLREQNTELASTNEQLARVNHNYMESLGFVTHELKAPLAAMQNMIDIVDQGYAGPIDTKAKGFLGKIKRSCLEMQEMVKNYLDLSRAERGEFTVSRSEIELVAEVITPAVDQTKALFDLREIDLKLRIPENGPPGELKLVADPEMLRIVIVNLLSNAAKYGRDGGAAELSVLRKGDQIHVSVRNEGDGFNAGESDALFKKFSRLKNANTRQQRGSGLGLFLCQQIAEMHEGSIQARSEPGAWAEFTLSIPARGAGQLERS